jgi:uncharacterized protein
MKITELYIYPVKSLGGIAVQTAEVQMEGLQYDRRWMLIDANGRFLSQREHAKMALFQTNISSDHLIIYFAGKGKIEVPLSVPELATTTTVDVWGDACSGVAVSQEADRWFSDILEQEVRLVRLPELSDRPADPRYAEGHRVSYADGFPFLIIGAASLRDLNQRMGLALSMDRFRPNIVFESDEPFLEDRMKELQIGECVFEIVKPCARCVVTTIDQQTAEQGKEPLKTLNTYRKIDNKVLFGQNMIAHRLGHIQVGDALIVNSWK